MRRVFLAWLLLVSFASAAAAQCSGAGGVPFNCAAGNTPHDSDILLGGSNTSPQAGKTIYWTIAQIKAAIASSNGALLIANRLSEIASAGSGAQASARTNIGIGPLGTLTIGDGLTSTLGALTANLLSVAGRTGAVTLSTADINGLGELAALAAGNGLTASMGALNADVLSVAGRTGAVTLSRTDISGLGALAPLNAGTGLAISGSNLNADLSTATGTLAANTLPLATGSVVGAMRPDGSTCIVATGVLTCTNSKGPAINRWGLMGDSRYRRSSDAPGITNSPGWYANGPWSWARTLSNGRFNLDLDDNLAVGGTTINFQVRDPSATDALLARLSPGDGFLFNGGTNTFVAANDPFGQGVIDDINLLLQKCQAKGVRLFLVIPGARTSWFDTLQYNSFMDYRRWALAWGPTVGVKVIDLYQVSADPNSNPPASRPFWLVDQLHQNTNGSIEEAKFMLRELNEYLPTEQLTPIVLSGLDLAPGTDTYPNQYGPLISGGMLISTGGTVTPPAHGSVVIDATTSIASGCSTCTPGLALGWTFSYAGTSEGLSGTVILNKDTDPDGVPVQVFQFVGVTGGINREPFQFLNAQANVDGRWAAGDQLAQYARMTVRGPARSVTLEPVFSGFTGGTLTLDSHRSLTDPNVTLTLTSTITVGNTLTATITDTHVAGSPIALPYTVQSGDNANNVVSNWFTQAQANAALTAAGYNFSVASNVLTVIAPTNSTFTVTFATTGTGVATITNPPGQYGNMPVASALPVAGIWQTPWSIPLPSEITPNASLVRMQTVFYIDSTLPVANDNIVTVRQRQPTVVKRVTAFQ